MHWLYLYLAVGWLIRLSMIPVVLRRQFAPGASLAWLGIVFLHPYIGGALYLMVGESRLGPRRVARHSEVVNHYRDPNRHPERSQHHISAEARNLYSPLVLQAEKISDLPLLTGSAIEFIGDTEKFVEALSTEIGKATRSVNLLYYIFACDGSGAKIVEAVTAAARRGVECRVLADAVASRPFFGRGGWASRLTEAGVKVAAALPVAPIRRRLARLDLRNHRKLAVIDDQLAFAGSHNVVDASYGGRRGNPWVDLTGKFGGPIVSELALVFAEDWYFETGEELKLPAPQALDPQGDLDAQVVPTGPTSPDKTFRRLFLTAIPLARKKLVLTTPYFVPDETTMLSLLMAADRGVEISLILPKVPDHLFTAFAGRAHFQSLLDAGVGIFQYRPGLLHAKTTTVDDSFSLFGSANLDVRSFNLNFELSVVLYGQEITKRLREIQEGYIADSDRVDAKIWSQRPVWRQYADRAIALLSPLL